MRHFMKTHRLLSVLYLFLVFHSLVLMKFSYWSHAIGPVVAVLMAGGGVAAFISLFGYKRRAVGEIESPTITRTTVFSRLPSGSKAIGPVTKKGSLPSSRSIAVRARIPSRLHRRGKTTSIVSFFVKGLGDYTKALPKTLKEGDLVTVEGPYGRFGFEHSKPRQIWVAGGIGIAPFVACIKALMKQPDGKTIDLFYSASQPEYKPLMDQLRSASSEAGVYLHTIVSAKDGRLNAERICQTVPEWKEADFWFCGPAGFGQSLRDDLVNRGLPADDFHPELFDMRLQD